MRGAPIVCKPEDAIRRFMGAEIDSRLVVGNFVLLKEAQDRFLAANYKGRSQRDQNRGIGQ